MSMPLYSLFLSVGVLALLALVVASAFAYAFVPAARKRLRNAGHFAWMRAIGTVSTLATAFALTYQIHYGLQVCTLCWWQRIFIFPIDVVAAVSVFRKVRGNQWATGILAAIGTFFAGYHYYYHFVGWVLKEPVFLPCSQGGLLPACTDVDGVLTFGFVTIPFMSLCVLLAVMWMSFLAGKAK